MGWAAFENRLADPTLKDKVHDYLENQRNGYGGDGTKITRPADTVAGSITPENPKYKPKHISGPDKQLINLLMGIELPQKSSPGSRFAARMARENGLTPTMNDAGVEITNPLYSDVVKMGFNPDLLNSSVENLPIANFTTKLKVRDDLKSSAGDVAMTRAGFMPGEATPEENRRVLNVGLNVTGGKPNSAEKTLAALRAHGMEVESHEIRHSNTEPTLIATVKRATDAAVHDASTDLRQDAIAVHDPATDTGKLLGPKAADWGEFNKDFFLSPTEKKEAAPAVYIGHQEGFGNHPGFDMFNLTRDLPGHPEGSTVSRQTLEEAGFHVPVEPKASFMPALKEPLEHAVGGELKLVHFGGQGLKNIDPANFGKSGLTPRSELSGQNRVYTYVQGKINKSDPVAVRDNVYGATVDGNRIYDGDKDVLDYGSVVNREKADQMLKDAGYIGVARSGKGYKQVELFGKTPVKPLASPTSKFMPKASPAQEKAFSESTVRDENGNLKPVFHATYSDFKKFKVGDLGYHFGTAEAANARVGKALADVSGPEVTAENAFDAFPEVRSNLPPGARGSIEGIAEGSRTLPVFLDIKNPLRMPDVGPWDNPEEVLFALPKDVLKKLPKSVGDAVDNYVAQQNDYAGATKNYEDFKVKTAKPALAAIRDGLKSLGHDGVVYKNAFEGVTDKNLTAADWAKHDYSGKDSYIAFDNAQIMPAFAHDAKARFMPKAPKEGAEEWIHAAAIRNKSVDVALAEGGQNRLRVLNRIADRAQKIKDAQEASANNIAPPDEVPAGEVPF